RGWQCRAHLHDRHVRATGQLCEYTAHDVRTGHETVRVLVMLVRADTVEAALRGIKQLVNCPIVVLTHAPRVGEFPPWRRDPHGFIAGLKVERQLTMRHEVEHTDLHACPPFDTMCALFGRTLDALRRGANTYHGLDDATIRGLSLATLHHRMTRRVCLAIYLLRSFCISAIVALW